MIDIVIRASSDKPIYRQIFEQIRLQILKGSLAAGQALPPIRTVARELHISVITIKKAWEELERSGLIVTMVGRGCFVADLTSNSLLDKRNTMVEEKIKQDVDYYKSMGLTLDELIESVSRAYKA